MMSTYEVTHEQAMPPPIKCITLKIEMTVDEAMAVHQACPTLGHRSDDAIVYSFIHAVSTAISDALRRGP